MELLGNKEELDSGQIIERISAFKGAYLGSLMYRDWAGFEAFSDALSLSISLNEIRMHVRSFVRNLENLIEEVSKRSVFHEGQEEPDFES
jgi:hypothetical protein